jgi:squalene-hopene/tetraprenyl-beta-curcumene cyclase
MPFRHDTPAYHLEAQRRELTMARLTPFSLLAIGGLVLTLSTVSADDNANNSKSNSKPAPPPDTITKEPTAPLDPRIDPGKVSQSKLPPLPHEVMLPMPPQFEIANDPRALPISEEHYEKAKKALERGLEFLRQQQHDSGAWLTDVKAAPTDQAEKLSPVDVAVTALAVKGFAQAEASEARQQVINRAVQSIMASREADGSFGGDSLSNYVTSSVVSALSSLDEFQSSGAVRDGVKWLEKSQWDQSEGLRAAQDWFGGAGYGNNGRPDLSNTQMMLDAMYDAGMSPDEPAFQKALAFISRTQNLEATNPTEWSTDDGGFIYTSVGGGESMASEAAGEGRKGELIDGRPRSLRSYGSMTYAGFKSMLYAGLSPDDVRVRAAYDWLRKNWTFEENPGLGQQGLYYYYHTLARALLVGQQHTITDDEGAPHNWREELIDAIVSRQREDGSWQNDADRWLEGLPVMATIYSVLALEEALKPVLEVH